MIPLPYSETDCVETKHCLCCKEDLPLTDFGKNRALKSGLNVYCKPCTREKVYQSRVRAERKKPIKHKPFMRAQPLWRADFSPREKVLRAIKRGATTQEEIGRATRLSEDVIGDVIAHLWDEGKLNLDLLKQRIYRLAA